jgi:HPt (histidine-containing phosphotransfer) domain-containing protein
LQELLIGAAFHDAEIFPMTIAETLFDLEQIAENWGGPDDPTYRIVLEIFVPETQRLVAEIGCADHAALPRLAHTLRGAAINVGAKRLAAAADVLEHAAPGATAGAIAALDTALAATLAALAAGGPAGCG